VDVDESDDFTVVVLGITMDDKPARKIAAAFREKDEACFVDNPFLLEGHFLIFVCTREAAWIISDHLGHIPVYRADGPSSGSVVFGTHINHLSKVSGRKQLDQISVAEFINDGRATYPHTIFRGISRTPPGSVLNAVTGGTRHYWLPRSSRGEPVSSRDLPELACNVRTKLVDNMVRLMSRYQTFGVMMSGGEDSRVITAIVQDIAKRQGKNAEANLFYDNPNREYYLARMACALLGTPFRPKWRAPDHAVRHLRETLHTIGAGLDMTNAHAVGLLDPLPGRLYVDGFASDSLFKALYCPVTYRKFGSIRVGLDRPIPSPGHPAVKVDPRFSPDIREAMVERRNRHVDFIRGQFPEYSVLLWYKLWPISDHVNFAFLDSNRKYLSSVSPFLMGSLVDLIKGVPETSKLNKRFFKQCFGPLMKSSGYLPRSDGRIPRLYPRVDLAAMWTAKPFLQLVDAYANRKAGQKLDPGPWQSERTCSKAVADTMASVSESSLAFAANFGTPSQGENHLGYWPVKHSWKAHHLLQLAMLMDEGLVEV
jgi:hypothetical protein